MIRTRGPVESLEIMRPIGTENPISGPSTSRASSPTRATGQGRFDRAAPTASGRIGDRNNHRGMKASTATSHQPSAISRIMPIDATTTPA